MFKDLSHAERRLLLAKGGGGEGGRDFLSLASRSRSWNFLVRRCTKTATKTLVSKSGSLRHTETIFLKKRCLLNLHFFFKAATFSWRDDNAVDNL